MKPMSDNRVIVIGAGAGGMMAAGRAAECGAEVLLLEKTEHAGNKLLISGQSRCNLSNARELDDFIAMYGPNGRFLYRAFDLFFRDELLLFFRRFGVETKGEADERVFPASNSSADVIRALESYISEGCVRVEMKTEVESIIVKEGCVTGIRVGQTEYPATAVILATGGASYPATGSSGAGYRMAAALGHRIVRLRPALVPLVVFETEIVKKMQGASLSEVRLTAFNCKGEDIPQPLPPLRDVGRGISGKSPRPPVIASRTGDVMLTHFGISGPAALQLSLAVVDALERGPVSVCIDLRPQVSLESERQFLQKVFDRLSKRTFRNILVELVTPRLIEPFLEMSAIPSDKCGYQIDAGERERLLRLIKCLCFNVKGPLSLASAMVTAGGISIDEIDPRTMGSRLVRGLYFCGEVMDIDADTGGFNLQAAFSTGHLAGESAALSS
jgi:predicted flavoprotein YhiN